MRNFRKSLGTILRRPGCESHKELLVREKEGEFGQKGGGLKSMSSVVKNCKK